METTKLLIFKWWETVASKNNAILSPTKSDLKRSCFDITCQILLRSRKKRKGKEDWKGKSEIAWEQESEMVGAGYKEGGRNLEFFESSSSETVLCQFGHLTFRYLLVYRMQLYSRGWLVMPTIVFLFPYKGDDGRCSAFLGTCVQNFNMEENCFLQEKCSLWQLRTNASYLNHQQRQMLWTGRQNLARHILTANLTYFKITSIFYYGIYLLFYYICNWLKLYSPGKKC